MQNLLRDFYPTPPALIRRMLDGIGSLDEMGPVLEPSAGKGDICDHLATMYRWARERPAIDVIELNPELHHILRGKGHNLVHDDFLTFETAKRYGLIVANFPFSDGDAHLAKALQMIERDGGTLICLVNAETIRNPHTHIRQAVAMKLDLLDATIDYIADAFQDAERPTSVEVALIRVTAPRPQRSSVILDGLERAKSAVGSDDGPTTLAETDVVRAMISRFRLECEAGTRLIDEYHALRPLMLQKLPRPGESDQFNRPVIEVTVNDSGQFSSDLTNDYVRAIRRKYWEALLHNDRINGVYTSNVISGLRDRLDDLTDADFSEFNIRTLLAELDRSVNAGVEQAIIDMFDEFSRKYAWEKHGSNVHYYNGWKTNQSYRVNRKIILPINGFSAYGWKDRLDSLYIRDRIADMVKAFNYLAGDLDDISGLVGSAIETANVIGQTRNLDFHYFTATFYKKGTCHITFKDQRLLDKFNIYGSQRKGWLPPGYGRRRYEDMDVEERAVVNAFQGEDAYREVLADTSYYLAGPRTLALAS